MTSSDEEDRTPVATRPTPAGWPRIASSLYYEEPAAAIDFLAAAFGFEVQVRLEEGGTVVHSQLTLPGGLIMVGGVVAHGREGDSWRRSPRQLGGGSTQALFIYVDDVDAHCARARAAGATIVEEPKVVDYGPEWWSDRVYEATDLEGHRFHFAQRLR